MFSRRVAMLQPNQLFDISKAVWQSFSSEPLVAACYSLEINKIASLQWIYCHLSADHVVLLGIDSSAGYQLAADMLSTKIETLSESDEQDAIIELMNCICGQLDRDHPADECFDLPQLKEPLEIKGMLNSLKRISEVTAKTGDSYFYIALFESDSVEDVGDME